MADTHQFSIHADLRYNVEVEGWLLLNITAGRCGAQEVIHESLTTNAGSDFQERIAPDGTTRFHGINVPVGNLKIEYQAEVTRSESEFTGSWEPQEESLVDLPAGVARYLYPSRYCESDKLVRFAMKEFGWLSSGHSRVTAICNWIYERIDYWPGATDEHSSAVDCLISRAGVCRDFAHLGIAFARALGIPARYGSAYVYNLSTPDFHAFFEVWLENRWWYYDASRLAPQAGFILIGTGHDAADTSVATMSGGVYFQSMLIDVKRLSSSDVNYTASPISFEEV
ncbi:MAG: transglutaminase family protein [Verrucomicrobiales bacterium]